jgi:hypothetical protein
LALAILAAEDRRPVWATWPAWPAAGFFTEIALPAVLAAGAVLRSLPPATDFVAAGASERGPDCGADGASSPAVSVFEGNGFKIASPVDVRSLIDQPRPTARKRALLR